MDSMIAAFIKNWKERHKKTLNITLHAIGVPLTVWAVVFLMQCKWLMALVAFTVGYILQFAGHAHEGSEVGEFLWVKNLFKK